MWTSVAGDEMQSTLPLPLTEVIARGQRRASHRKGGWPSLTVDITVAKP